MINDYGCIMHTRSDIYIRIRIDTVLILKHFLAPI